MPLSPIRIDPNIPMGMPDFARLYSAYGTPDESASYIHMNFPTEAKSLLSERWSAMGMGVGPEEYFSNPTLFPPSVPAPAMPVGATAAAATVGRAPAVAGAIPLTGTWPAFRNDTDRLLAMLQGTYDPNYASPGLKANAVANAALSERDMKEREAFNLSTNPLNSAQTTSDVLAAQLASGIGGVKEFIARQQGLDPAAQLALPVEQRAALKAYLSEGGIGNLPRVGGNPIRLDYNVATSPEFAMLAKTNPPQAKAFYRALTGRDFDEDQKQAKGARDEYDDSTRKYAAGALSGGATFDPTDKSWQVWNYDEAPANNNALAIGAAPRPYRQLTKATPWQNEALNRHYPTLAGGRPLPTVPPSSEWMVTSRKEHEKNLASDQEFQNRLAAQKAKYGYVTDQMFFEIFREYMGEPPAMTPGEKAAKSIDNTFKAVLGSKPSAEWNIDSMTAPENRNPIGRFMDRFIDPADPYAPNISKLMQLFSN